MATPSTGITVTFGSITFAEVTGLSWSYGSGLPKGRNDTWTDDLGTVSVQCLSSTGISTGNYGQRNDLAITGGGADLTHKAAYQGIAVAPELNGVTRYSVTFKLLDG